MALSGSILSNQFTVPSGPGAGTTVRLRLDWNATQNIAGNSSSVYYEVVGVVSTGYVNSQSFTATVNGHTNTSSALRQLRNGDVILKGTVAVAHGPNGDGSFGMSFGGAVFNYGSRNVTGSGTGLLNSIPRASTITTFNAFTIGNNIPWAVDRKHAAYTHWVRLSVGGVIIADAPGQSGASGTLGITQEMKDLMLSKVPNSTSINAILQVWTYTNTNQTSQVGSVQSKTVTATVHGNVIPDFTSISHSENVSLVSSLVGLYVKNKSRLNLGIVGAKAGYGATINSYRITCLNSTIAAASGTTNVLTSSGTVVVTGTVTDSRGRTISKQISVNVLDYFQPQISEPKYYRCDSAGVEDPFGTYITIEFKVRMASLLNGSTQKNKTTTKIQTKRTSSTSFNVISTENYTAISYTVKKIFSGYAVDYSFNVAPTVKDIFDETFGMGMILIGEVLQHWAKHSTAFGMLLPGTDHNIYAGNKGIYSVGQIYQNDGKKVGNGYLGHLPSGNTASHEYWRNIPDGTYSGSKDTATLTNSPSTYGTVIHTQGNYAASEGSVIWVDKLSPHDTYILSYISNGSGGWKKLINNSNTVLVVASGTNYRKYSDGTMEQWGTLRVDLVANQRSKTRVALPQNFINTSYVIPSMSIESIAPEIHSAVSSSNKATDSFHVNIVRTTTNWVMVDWFAIGRWK